jgi:prepilin-type N-terminal cleavage/methylation domain-containing protein
MGKSSKGFTLVEVMVVVAIVGILAGLCIFGLSRAVNAARVTGNRFSLIQTIDFARQRAIAVGRDVYVVFANIDRPERYPSPLSARVLVYDDTTSSMRASLDALLAGIDANPAGVRERFIASDSSAMLFRFEGGAPVIGTIVKPGYVTLSASRQTPVGDCSPALCTFCEKQGDSCVGAVRFSPDGTARIVTGPEGTGGVIALVAPDAKDRQRAAVLAITEPAGLVVTLKDSVIQ